ncbi:hypothetical protein, partial [Salmonella enterica]|uniref:hypothetical protein n=1 Tax=Salmonella enterica TaxID=28901 RepID=UPI0019D58644
MSHVHAWVIGIVDPIARPSPVLVDPFRFDPSRAEPTSASRVLDQRSGRNAVSVARFRLGAASSESRT